MRQGSWPILMLLLMAVLVPTVSLLWLMTAATENERLAIHGKLREAYAARLDEPTRRLESAWRKRLGQLGSGDTVPAEHFKRLVTQGACDGALIYEAAGGLAYPTERVPSGPGEPHGAEWLAAERLELTGEQALAAADAYAKLAEASSDPDAKCYALLGQARCLARGQDTARAARLFADSFDGDEAISVVDETGRRPALNAQLRALELLRDADRGRFDAVYGRLAERLGDYSLVMPSGQRRFLMRRLVELDAARAPTALADAEDLAAAYIETDFAPAAPGVFAKGPLADLWQLCSADGRTVALFRGESLRALGAAALGESFAEPGVEVVLVPALAAPDSGTAIARAVDALPGWEWRVKFEGPGVFDEAADRRVLAYAWSVGLAIVAIVLLAVLIGYVLMRQLRLARLKNELMAVVSHELKTPLASMRVLVDTLLEGRCPDPVQQREYLELIERENTRLSHLIDNFLTFSRMERNKQAFDFAEVRIEDAAKDAAAVMRERFASTMCRLALEIEPGLPPVRGDRDALVTVLLNLLDNAWKYSGDEKRIVLRGYARNGDIYIEVEDNGIGLSRRAARRVFERFYQADRSLSRKTGGCGLGLSIVRFIVAAHGGSVSVASRAGVGSTFTVRLPAVRAAGMSQEEVPAHEA